MQSAKVHLEKLLEIATESKIKADQADAALKLGLLLYKDGDVRKSVDYL